MPSDQEELQKRVLKGKSPLEYLHHQSTTNPKSPNYRPTRKNAHPERDLQNAILEWLTLKRVCHVRLDVKPPTYFVGGHLIRTPSPLKGWPDILLIVNGLAVGLEVKAGTQQSAEQKEVERYVVEVGKGRYHVVKSLGEVEGIVGKLLQ